MFNKAFEEIAVEASRLLNDSNDCDPEYDFTRWSKDELMHYARDAASMIYMLAPKKFTDCKTITLRQGSLQKLPESCVKLTKVLGVADNSRAKSSIAPVVNERLGELFQSGCSESLNPNEYSVRGYTLEESSDNIFYVDPPVPADGIEVDVICVCEPDFGSSDYQPEGWMHNAIIEWVLYRAYSSEDESAQSGNNSTMHLQHFYSIMDRYVESQSMLGDNNTGVNLGGRSAAT